MPSAPGPDPTLSEKQHENSATSPEPDTMRVAEVAVVGPNGQTKHEFIRTACGAEPVQTGDLTYGCLQINEQLAVHLYGLKKIEEKNPSWELIAKKLLGYIVLFDWDDVPAIEVVKSTVDAISLRHRIPIIIAANVKHPPTSIPVQLAAEKFDLAEQSKLTFCNVSDEHSSRNILVTLIDCVLYALK